MNAIIVLGNGAQQKEIAPMQDIYFQGKLTFTDYHKAQKILSFKRQLWLRGIMGLALIYCLVKSFTAPEIQTIMRIMVVYFLLFITVFSPLLFRRRCRRLFQSQQRLNDHFVGFLNDEGFHINDDKGDPALTSWARFCRWQWRDGLLLLHFTPISAVILPQHYFAATDHERLKELLRQQISRAVPK